MTVCIEKKVKEFTVVPTQSGNFKKKEVLPPWPRAKQMASQPWWDLRITF